ncbi:cyclic nucleotide-binding domain-containing protein [Actinacidiphila soli]|uniref:cyclic nucleotide-binding domain-containing protein n=1 Tax=Actinacidiphila soli TaxID=2487275 RepID=UPI000FCA5101|nr:cyclic nucleotide-binding domain-containing protein [Actinacidiphila soli]
MTTTAHLLDALPAGSRERLLRLGHEVTYPAGALIFEEGGSADRFWIISGGSVTLNLHVPGRRPPTVETLGPGDLLGWSWLFPPYVWHLGAAARSPVRADEFDAATVRVLCGEDLALGYALTHAVAGIIAHRLKATRMRLLDLYGPYGSGPAT